MINNESEVQKLVEVSRMYYEENMTQDEIARVLNVSRPLVSKMLGKAREIGIINIQIKSPYVNNNLLMGQLINLFNLRDGIIVPEANTEYMTEQLILNQAFNYIKGILPETANIGFSWGSMVGSLIAKIESSDLSKDSRGDVCPLIGNSTIPNRDYHSNELIRIFAEKTGFTPHYLFAPAFPSTQQEMENFINTDNYSEISTLWSKLDSIIFSIGTHPSAPDHATASRFGNTLNEQGAVGKFLSYYYNREGSIIRGENDYAIHIPLDKIRKVKRVIALCSCNTNINSVIGALRTGFITHLITDEKTASDIIKYK